MIAKPVWVGANGAMAYHTESQDNYYQNEGGLGEWSGDGAKLLGLDGEVDPKDLENILWGRDPNTGEQLVSARVENKGTDKEDRKRASLDFTFNASKSISVAMELATATGDKDLANELVRLHEKAVNATMLRVQNHIRARYSENGNVVTKNTDNFIVAKFTHDISRAVEKDGTLFIDPSLHTHALIMNMTKGENGWKAIESRALFRVYMQYGQTYRNELKFLLNQNGFKTRVTDEIQGFFELENIDDKLIDLFSKRSHQINDKEIIEELQQKYPSKSLSEIKQLSAYRTRTWKGEIDRALIREQNLQSAKEHGFEKLDIKSENIQKLTIEQINDRADKAIEKSINILLESQSVFTKEAILNIGAKLSINDSLGIEELEGGFERNKRLQNITQNYFSTKDMINKERYILKYIYESNVEPLESAKSAKEKVQKYSKNREKTEGFELTPSQKDAAEFILKSKSNIIGIQGDAGTGKTTMLKAINVINSNRRKLIGLSFTAKASSGIESETRVEGMVFDKAGIQSQTIASFLNKVRGKSASELKEYYEAGLIVDEVSMLSTQDAYELVQFSKLTKSQLVLIGDEKQLKAIGAGDIFTFLKKNGLSHVVMNDVIRQKDPLLIKVVKELNNYNALKAFELLDDAGKLNESKSMVKDVVAEYYKSVNVTSTKNNYDKSTNIVVSLDPKSESKVVLTSTNEARQKLNKVIRTRLKADKVLINSQKVKVQSSVNSGKKVILLITIKLASQSLLKGIVYIITMR